MLPHPLRSARLPGLTAAVLGLVLVAGAAQALPILYGSRVAFDLANPGLPLEDFEEMHTGFNSTAAITGPLDATTNNGIFLPGEILPNLSVIDAAAGANGLAGVNNWFGQPTKTIGVNGATIPCTWTSRRRS